VYPGARAAVLRTAEKKVGVIGTAATIRTGSYTKAIQSIDASVKVYGKACPLFVPIVEEGLSDSDIARLTSQHYLIEMMDIGVDCLILGCTHYPLLLETIQGTVGTRMQLLDSALWTAKEAHEILTALNALAPEGTKGYEESSFFVTDLTPQFEELARVFLGMQLPNIRKITLEELVR
jgi:glutamate racemase